MQYLYQFLIILGFSAVGETLSRLIPFPIPAAVYGIVLLFVGLQTGLVKEKWVAKTGSFLQSILPLVFVAPIVNLISYWDVVRQVILPVAAVVTVSTVAVFAVAGRLTQHFTEGKHD